MKRIALVALLANLVAVGVYAQGRPERVTMKSSGDMLATTIELQADTITDEETLAGDGTLGAFTYHGLRADALAPQSPVPPATCSTPLFFSVVTGAGVFRFEDGSLLVVNVTSGGICIDLTAGMAELTETYQIARGTGRFAHASGTLTLTTSVIPVVFNASGNAQFLTLTGKFEGRVSGISHERER
jgi:hypothetical protein